MPAAAAAADTARKVRLVDLAMTHTVVQRG
jgi:hypothetical protein